MMYQRTPFRRVPLAAAALALLGASAAAAQEKKLTLTASTRADDNFSRASDEGRQGLRADGADLINYVGAVGEATTRIGAVDVDLNANAGHSFFLRNARFNTLDYGAHADAEYLGERESLRLTLNHVRRPIAFDDTIVALNARQYRTDAGLDVSRDVLGYVRLVGNVAYRRSSASTGSVLRNNNEFVAVGGGVGYYSPTGNRVTLEYRAARSRGLVDTVLFVANDPLLYRARFSEQSVLSRLRYSPSALLRFDGSFGYTWHDDRSVLAADFKGFNTDASLTWEPLQMLTVGARARRAFSSENALLSNGIEVTSYSVSADAKVGANATVGLFAGRESRQYRYDVRFDDPITAERTEDYDRLGARATYLTASRFQLGVNYDFMRRRSTVRNFDYNSNAVSLTLSRALQF